MYAILYLIVVAVMALIMHFISMGTTSLVDFLVMALVGARSSE